MNNNDVAEHLEELNKVAVEYLKGKNETQISTELAIPRARVANHLREWRTMASNSDAVRARAREALAGADLHYNKLIKQAYEIIEDAEQGEVTGSLNANQSLDHRGRALKMVADLEAKRIDMLQRAGLLENQELADKLIEQEKLQEATMKIITEVVAKCPTCKPKVLQRMSGLGDPVTIVEGQVG